MISEEPMGAGPDPAYRLPAYVLEDLWFRYGAWRGLPPGRHLRREEVRLEAESDGWVLSAVRGVVRAGEVIGVTGPNGSGKTSLLKLLAKVLAPIRGRVELFGHDLSGLGQEAVARTVALVPQDSQTIFPFTVAELVLMGRYPHHQRGRGLGRLLGFGWETAQDRRLAAQAMDETDITHLAGRPIAEVSGGERQRAIIARALTQDPQVLLLDEPTAHLDLNHQLEICHLLRRLNAERGLTIVLVSHDLNLASQYCDRLWLLKDGRVYQDGPPAAVLQPEVLREVYGCAVLVDRHPDSDRPRVNLPAWAI